MKLLSSKLFFLLIPLLMGSNFVRAADRNLITLAREAKDKNDTDRAVNYYQKFVLQFQIEKSQHSEKIDELDAYCSALEGLYYLYLQKKEFSDALYAFCENDKVSPLGINFPNRNLVELDVAKNYPIQTTDTGLKILFNLKKQKNVKNIFSTDSGDAVTFYPEKEGNETKLFAIDFGKTNEINKIRFKVNASYKGYVKAYSGYISVVTKAENGEVILPIDGFVKVIEFRAIFLDKDLKIFALKI